MSDYSYFLRSPLVITSLQLIAGVLLLTINASSSAQAIQRETPSAVDKLPEEITVSAPTYLPRLRREVYKAEDNLFDIYNALNTDDRFDINCELERRPGSRMKVRVCRPNYFWIARAEEGEQMYTIMGRFAELSSGGSGSSLFTPATPGGSGLRGPGMSGIGFFNGQMEEKIKEAIGKSPDLVEAAREYSVINEHYYEMRNEKFGKDEE